MEELIDTNTEAKPTDNKGKLIWVSVEMKNKLKELKKELKHGSMDKTIKLLYENYLIEHNV
jgi:hypothetical protein